MNYVKKLRRTIVFTLKMLLFMVLFFVFFGIFSIDNPWLFNFSNLSRTSGVTMVTFVVLGLTLMSVYGGYSIGEQKSKPIIYSMTLATVMTDLVTHFQLCIMNAGVQRHNRFVYETPHLLVLAMLLQILVITVFAYFGNHIYFTIEPPERSCIIAGSTSDLGEIIPKVQKFRKQYKISEVVHVHSPDLYDVIDRNDTVFLKDLPLAQRKDLTDYCFNNNKNLYYTFEVCDVVCMNAKFSIIDDQSFVAHPVKDLTFEQRILKRLMDISLSLIAIALTSPMMLGAAVAIKCEDGGKVFYRQSRATKYGRVFQVLKFRTMHEENSVNKSVTADDDRITRVGRILRKFRMDELPQFFNILKGEMSLVGPRPEMLENVQKYTEELPEFAYRLRAKAGLTGLAQINGKYNTSPKDKLVLDLMYIERFNIWQDIKILFQTFTVLFKADDSTEAFSEKEDFSFDPDHGPEGAGEAEDREACRLSGADS